MRMVVLIYTETSNLTIDTRRIKATDILGIALFRSCSRVVITDDFGAKLMYDARRSLELEPLHHIICVYASADSGTSHIQANEFALSFDEALGRANKLLVGEYEQITVFGTSLIESVMASRRVSELTAINVMKGVRDVLSAPTSAPKLDLGRIWSLVNEEKSKHAVYSRETFDSNVFCIKSRFVGFEEMRYLQLIVSCMGGFVSPNRTGISTRTIVGRVIEFELMEGGEMIVPLLTTRRISFKSIMVELLAFINADTTTARMQANDVKIWDGNSTRAFHALNGRPDYEDGELGPIYGFQWRHWNGGADGVDGVGGANGIDQLRDVIEAIKADPFSRRHLVSAWNPEQIPDMALPPCHFAFQFVVRVGQEAEPHFLDCVVSMRSSDTVLGLPFNIASYAVLTHIVAKLTGCVAGRVVMMLTHAHIYENHIEGVQLQLQRAARRFPVLRFNPQAARATTIDEIGACEWKQFQISGYYPHDSIAFKMAV